MKIWRKTCFFFTKFRQNENIIVKMGYLFAYFDKNILSLRQFGKKCDVFRVSLL